MSYSKVSQEMSHFMEQWENCRMKDIFTDLYSHLKDKASTMLSFKGRPKVTYSLRGKHEEQDQDLFVMVDVIDDDPQNRWLSVCFYGDMITDPDELGDFVPEGLLGEDAICFDLDEEDPKLLAYIKARIDEAHTYKN